MRHDLAGKVDCSAQDADLAGRDYTSDVLFDGSRWLGLNRKSFLSTACIRQADILRVLGDADSLQEDMQRAAATAGTDATAAEALGGLEEYRTKHVGTRRAPTKPLVVTETKATEASAALEEARAKHGEYMRRRADLERCERKAQDAKLKADAVAAALAEAEAASFEDRVKRVRNLDACFPDGAPHPSPARDAIAAQVTAALTSWQNRPGLTEVTGPTAQELHRMIAESDARLVAARATVAEREAEEADRRLSRIRKLDALFPDGPPRDSAADEDLAAQVISVLRDSETLPPLHEPEGPSVEELEGELAAFDAKVSAAPPVQSRRRLWLLAPSVLAVTGGVAAALALQDLRVVGAVIAIAGVAGALIWAAMSRASSNSSKLDEMEREAKRLRNDAATRAADVGEASLADARRQRPGKETLSALRDKAEAAHRQFRDERVRLEEFANTLPSVADAEEALDDALREKKRVAALERTLGTTIRFLEQAQEQIQRNIAPIPSATVLEWLPRVTGGRYDDCRVDPETLLVEVRGSDGWRSAQLLSHGTAEQVYLLLRLALSRHLTKEGEVCPLILDDVVSASDALRKRVVLETLLAISESTQVVLFTHEDDVRDWAREHLAEPSDHLTEIALDAEAA